MRCPNPPDLWWPSLMTTIGPSSRLPICWRQRATMFDCTRRPRCVCERGGLSEIDCLISDIGMPDMNGFELRRLALSERPELPVILITGRPELRAQYSSIIERDRYFEKPFDGQQLLAAIRTALGSARPKGAA